MDKITQVYIYKKINIQDFDIANKVTGETNEFASGSLNQMIKTNQVKYDYGSFIYLNTNKLSLLLENGITLSDLGLLTAISKNLLFNYNICMLDDEKPHTTNSISKIIGYSEQRTKIKLHTLVELGVLAYQKIPGRKDFGKVYIVNPLYIRIGEKFSDSIPEMFNYKID